MAPQNFATLRTLMLIGYGLGVIDVVLACCIIARAVLAGRAIAIAFRKWGRRSQTLFYLVTVLLSAPSIVLFAIGLWLPSAFFTDIGAIGILIFVLIMAIVGLL